MAKLFVIIVFVASLALDGCAQTKSIWTEADRKYLIDNLERTKSEMIKATENLSPAQWSYKESSDKWSIGQVLEHMGLYERIFDQEAIIMVGSTSEPELNRTARPDSVYLNWMDDPNPHHALTNATPLGLMKGKDNLTFFLYGREIIIDFVKTTQKDLKAHYTFRDTEEKRRSIHALMVVHFGHTDRHLRQIERIKKSIGYPK